MKMIAFAAAGLVAAAMLPVGASAAPQATVTKSTTVNSNGAVTRTTVTRERSGMRGPHWRTRCKTWWHHGRKVRQCKRVRVRW